MLAKPTKACQVEVVLKSGTRLSGLFPVPANTSTCVRPTDAIRQVDDQYLLLCDVTVREGDDVYDRPTLLVRGDAISHIELTSSGWMTLANTPSLAIAAS
ncbi:MAG: hypothetical protein C4547_09470 [Phycisphaerales bacterium]|nr:MAG: hypothetical protein C4547_09470 [Phycisphaerales bacterium]